MKREVKFIKDRFVRERQSSLQCMQFVCSVCVCVCVLCVHVCVHLFVCERLCVCASDIVLGMLMSSYAGGWMWSEISVTIQREMERREYRPRDERKIHGSLCSSPGLLAGRVWMQCWTVFWTGRNITNASAAASPFHLIYREALYHNHTLLSSQAQTSPHLILLTSLLYYYYGYVCLCVYVCARVYYLLIVAQTV